VTPRPVLCGLLLGTTASQYHADPDRVAIQLLGRFREQVPAFLMNHAAHMAQHQRLARRGYRTKRGCFQRLNPVGNHREGVGPQAKDLFGDTRVDAIHRRERSAMGRQTPGHPAVDQATNGFAGKMLVHAVKRGHHAHANAGDRGQRQENTGQPGVVQMNHDLVGVASLCQLTNPRGPRGRLQPLPEKGGRPEGAGTGAFKKSQRGGFDFLAIVTGPRGVHHHADPDARVAAGRNLRQGEVPHDTPGTGHRIERGVQDGGLGGCAHACTRSRCLRKIACRRSA
jgi:hypothetical protein